MVAEMQSRPFSVDQPSLTSWWVSECFGEEALQQLEGRPVLCSGSILGSKRAVRRAPTPTRRPVKRRSDICYA